MYNLLSQNVFKLLFSFQLKKKKSYTELYDQHFLVGDFTLCTYECKGKKG